ncbi:MULTISPECIES: lipase [unclassified Leptolyngbya]|uniref:esterase/lipase family protein n=1 Tax=unclassified Leptolyngbya TaxID=2650499 RepID=UPI00168512D3|nr:MULTISPECIES: lipase [unclassified Leptolyngbya]MBD1909713.1 lipase [Leptolyngbya sp. FACHB-8]MBD2155979.1 lipase [Leptolyngbya sp. FACHB-16]
MPLPTVILPGYLASALPYREMETALEDCGISVATVPLRRRDWLPTLGGRSVRPILEQLDTTVRQIQERTGSDRINLVGHSAGGWIARIYLGEVPYQVHDTDSAYTCLWKAHPNVATLVTLGTPHVSQERWTRRNLDFVKNNYPGAFYSTVRYVCVAGKSIEGDRFRNWFSYSSYEQTIGQGNAWGDGITPIEAALLDGAENHVLDNVVHSPRPGKLWYGSPEIARAWAQFL